MKALCLSSTGQTTHAFCPNRFAIDMLRSGERIGGWVKKANKLRVGSSLGDAGVHFASNRLLASLSPSDRALVEPHVQAVSLDRDETLFDAGEDVVCTYFPGSGTMTSLVITMHDGRVVEAATIGREGAVGGIVSAGHKPAFARAVVQIAGPALRIDTAALEVAKEKSRNLRELFSRYADVLLAQILQSVACNALHPLEARCCRWLLTTHDRAGRDDIPMTQEYLAEMLGVQRTTVNAVARSLQNQGLIAYRRGIIRILSRSGLERASCECYADVERHYKAVLPEIKPQKVIDASVSTA